MTVMMQSAVLCKLCYQKFKNNNSRMIQGGFRSCQAATFRKTISFISEPRKTNKQTHARTHTHEQNQVTTQVMTIKSVFIREKFTYVETSHMLQCCSNKNFPFCLETNDYQFTQFSILLDFFYVNSKSPPFWLPFVYWPNNTWSFLWPFTENVNKETFSVFYPGLACYLGSLTLPFG